MHPQSHLCGESGRGKGSRGFAFLRLTLLPFFKLPFPQAGIGKTSAGVGASVAALLSAPVKKPPINIAARMVVLGLEDLGQAAWPSCQLVETLAEVPTQLEPKW